MRFECTVDELKELVNQPMKVISSVGQLSKEQLEKAMNAKYIIGSQDYMKEG